MNSTQSVLRRERRWPPVTFAAMPGIVALCLFLSGCAGMVKKMAVNELADMLAGGGTVYSADDSPYLVGEAIPFGLKLMETLLAENPEHARLLLATSEGFLQYAYGYPLQEADAIEDDNLDKAIELRGEARKLLIRSRNYALRGLETSYPGFEKQLRSSPEEALASLSKKDMPYLYTAGASWAAAISVSKNDSELIGDLPIVEKMMERALKLDEAYDHGAIHGFFISYEMTRLGETGDLAKKARKHFDRAVELSEGKNASYYVAMAEATAIPLEDKEEFQSLLEKALEIDADKKPEWRLANLLFQKRARWLLSRVDRLFL